MAYRGKYPHHIKSVSIGKPYGGALCVTNAGFRYQVFPVNAAGSSKVPGVGADISHYVQSPDYRVQPLDGDVSNARG
jgi:hypothetical protein